MPNPQTDLKAREARFFLALMRERDKNINLGKKEEFGFCLSAFLAAVSVQDVLKQKHQAAFAPVRKAWLESLDADVRVVIDRMWHNRRKAIHQGRNPAKQDIQQIPWATAAANGQRQRSPILIQPFMYDSGATVGVAVYTLTIDGKQVPVVEACERYVSALENLVARFEAPAA